MSTPYFQHHSKEELVILVQDLTKREERSRKEKQDQDEEFGRHRAMFKEMYMQKEGTDLTKLNSND
jgi:hypothetical protein